MGRPLEGRVLWERLRIGEPLQVRAPWAVSTPSVWAGPVLTVTTALFNVTRGCGATTFSRSGTDTFIN